MDVNNDHTNYESAKSIAIKDLSNLPNRDLSIVKKKLLNENYSSKLLNSLFREVFDRYISNLEITTQIVNSIADPGIDNKDGMTSID